MKNMAVLLGVEWNIPQFRLQAKSLLELRLRRCFLAILTKR